MDSHTPNYTNPDTRGPGLVVVNGISLALVLVFVSLRIYTNVRVQRWVGNDDTWIMVAAVRMVEIRLVCLLTNCRSLRLDCLRWL